MFGCIDVAAANTAASSAHCSAGILAEMDQKRGAMQKGRMKKAASTSSNLSNTGSTGSGSSGKGGEDGLLMNRTEIRTPPV